MEGDTADAEGQRMNPDEELKQASASEIVTSDNKDTVTSEDDAREGNPLAVTQSDAHAVEDLTKALTTCTLFPTGGMLSVRRDAAQVSDQVGLIVPTSLCSGQVATLLTQRLNDALKKEPDAFGASWGCAAWGGTHALERARCRCFFCCLQDLGLTFSPSTPLHRRLAFCDTAPHGGVRPHIWLTRGPRCSHHGGVRGAPARHALCPS